MSLTLAAAFVLGAVQAHEGGVKAAAFRPDGVVAATGGWDNIIRVWLTADGTQRRTLKGHTSHITDLSYSGDGKYLASSGADGTVRIWSGTDSKLIRTIKAGTSYVSGVAMSPDGKYVYGSGYDNRVKRWRVSDGKLMTRYVGLPSDAYCMALSPDGRLVAGGGPGGTRVWDAATGKELYNFDSVVTHDRNASDLSFSANSGTLAICRLGDEVKLILLSSKRVIETIRGGFLSCAFGATGGLVLGHSPEGGLQYRSPGGQVQELGFHKSGIEAAVISADGTMALSGDWDGHAGLWDLERGRLLFDLTP